MTHANAAFPSHDGTFVQSDDQDEPAPRRASLAYTRLRSSNLSIPARPSVLKTVQLHARARHAFAATADQDPVSSLEDPSTPLDEQQQISHAAKSLLEARRSGNSIRAAEAVRQFRQSVVHPSVREFNAALEALQATRRPGEPLNLLLETYNDMLRHSLLPNARTYVALIDSLTARDHEVHSAIASINRRIQYRALTGFADPVADQADHSRIEMLRRENNFSTAISLFETVISIDGNRSLLGHTYMSLLRSCALNSNVDAAINVWAQLQKRDDFFPSAAMFLEMIRAYTNAGRLSDAEQIFDDYKSALKRGNIYISWSRDQTDPNRLNLLVWNQMIETYFRFDRPDKAVALVDQMMQTDLSQLQQQVVVDPPPVASATFTAVLTGFCQIGDVDTALVWFDRLLAQPPSSQDPFKPVGVAMKPDEVAWQVMLDALAVKGMLHDLNRLFSVRLAENPRRIRVPQRTVVYSANMAQLPSMDDEKYTTTLAWLQSDVLNSSEFKLKHRFNLTTEIATAYLERKMYTKAFDVISAYLSDFIKTMSDSNLGLGFPPPLSQVQEMQLKFTDKLYQVSQGDVPYSIPMHLARFAVTLRITQPPSFVPFFLHSYALSRKSKNLPVTQMTRQDWELLLMAANSFESLHDTENPPQPPIPDFAYQDLASIIRDLAGFKVDLNKMNKDLVRQVLAQLSQRLGSDGMRSLLKKSGFISVLTDLDHDQANEDAASETSGADSGYASEAPFKMDFSLSKKIMETVWPSANLDEAMNSIYIKFQKTVKAGRCPHTGALAVLIHWNSRWGRMDEIRFIYTVAQRMLRTLEKDKMAQTAGWLEIENAMISALAQCGDIEGAHQYRQRILANGGVPDAQAYGALILNVKDTTDDASNALELFQESQTYRVQPTQFLYNNIISKLAKARKADYALALFKQMKELNLPPTSVTYGAVIGACARVGDLHSAEALFVEMTQDPNFRPRIPPYNTMMQMYTTTKPDRARVLYFYEEMCKVNIFPSAHTYKVCFFFLYHSTLAHGDCSYSSMLTVVSSLLTMKE